MIQDRKTRIASRFGAQAALYNERAMLQKEVAETLASFLPLGLQSPRILEIGCGTGFLTALLLMKYKNAEILATDISDDMVTYCREKFKDHTNAHFGMMDGEDPVEGRFDLIVSSMAVQWFAHPLQSLDKLARQGPVHYATIGHDNFPEWQRALEKAGIATSGLLEMPEWPEVGMELYFPSMYGDAAGFLQNMKDTGANTSREGHLPSAGQLRKAMRAFNENNPTGEVTWHIVFGEMPCLTPRIRP